jgi:starch synthase (maltosyl-transferring)
VPIDTQFQVHDLIGDARYLWYGPENYIEIDPALTPGHVFAVRTRHRTERDFDYYL